MDGWILEHRIGWVAGCAALLLWPLAALANDAVGYVAQVRDDSQVRTVTGAGASSTGIVELFPLLGAAAQLENLSFAASYAPQILFNDVTQQSAPNILHVGRAGVEVHPIKEDRVALSEQFSYGELDTLTLNATAPSTTPNATVPPLQRLPSLVPVPYSSSVTDGLVDLTLSSRVKSVLDLVFATGGGVGTGSSTIPGTKMLQGTYELDYHLTRPDVLGTRLLASQTSFSTGQRTQLTELREIWRSRLDRITDMELTLGGAIANAWQGTVKGDELLMLPTAGASLKSRGHWQGSTISLDASATLGPYIDWLSGIVYERAEGSTGFQWDMLADHWSFFGRARGAVAVEAGPYAGTALAAGELNLAYYLRKDFSIQGGSRLIWQRMPAAQGSPYVELTTYISLVLSEKGSL
jgi:hypothetical protein